MPQRSEKKTPKAPLAAPSDRHVLVLRESGLRVTPVRLAILRVMEEATSALNAQEIFDKVAARVAGEDPVRKAKPARAGNDEAADAKPDRVTVYRTLNSLVDSGIAHKVDPGDRVFRFSLTDHARCSEEHHVHEHPHFVCDSCGKVECLQDTEVIIQTKSHEGKDHAHRHGHQAHTHGSAKAAAKPDRRLKVDAVMLRGTCGECSK